jgi:hypothetical protein
MSEQEMAFGQETIEGAQGRYPMPDDNAIFRDAVEHLVGEQFAPAHRNPLHNGRFHRSRRNSTNGATWRQCPVQMSPG